MAAEEIVDYGLNTVSNPEIQDELASIVQKAYTEARQHKRTTGITDRLIRNLTAKKCKYQAGELELLKDGNDVYIGICALKARAAASWLIDIIVNNIDKPWTLTATPEPDLPEKLKLQAIAALLQELPQFNTFEALKDRATQIKSALQDLNSKQAIDATKRMETRIDDQLKEGGWTDVFASYVDDLTVFPTAFLRGPIVINEPSPSWDGDKFTVSMQGNVKVRSISAFDAYPSPDSSTPQNGEYFIEAVKFTQSDMHDLIGVPTFLVPNIRQVMNTYSEGYVPTKMEDSSREALEDKNPVLGKDSRLEVIIYNGKIKGRILASKGVIVSDPQKYYECEVWVVGNYVLRAILNPNPVGKRPIFGTSYVKINGDIWGQSVIDLVYDTMRVCNASARAVVKNMGYSSGPIGEVVSDRISESDDETAIAPYKIFRVGPDLTGTGSPAFRFHNVAAVSADLMAVFDKYMKLADDLSGVPAYVLGNPQVAGAGRTLGGLSMLMGNAAKGIKNVQLNIDRDIITGIVTAFYYYNMQTSSDIGIKADAKVLARGATGLLQRELAQTRTVEVLQLLTPYVTQGFIDKTAVQYILRSVLQNTGMDVDKIIPDPDRAGNIQDLQNLLGNGQEAASQAGTSTPQPLPPQSLPQPNLQMAPIPTPVNLATGA